MKFRPVGRLPQRQPSCREPAVAPGKGQSHRRGGILIGIATATLASRIPLPKQEAYIDDARRDRRNGPTDPRTSGGRTFPLVTARSLLSADTFVVFAELLPDFIRRLSSENSFGSKRMLTPRSKSPALAARRYGCLSAWGLWMRRKGTIKATELAITDAPEDHRI